MEQRVNFSVDYYSGAEKEVIIVRIPNNELDPRLGYKTKVFESCEELAAWMRSYGAPLNPLPDVNDLSCDSQAGR